MRRDVIGYKEVGANPDGTPIKEPIYKDYFADMKEIAYYTKKDAVFVPRIPTITDFDDWFIRIQSPASIWVVNWGYASRSGTRQGTITATTYNKEDFNANYYRHPDDLYKLDLGGDRGESAEGVHAKYLQKIGEYVILLRTDNASATQDWWIRIGIEK